MSILRFCGIWLLIIMLCLFMIGVPLLQLTIYTYQAVTTGSWICAGVCLVLFVYFVWMLVSSWRDVEHGEIRSRDDE